MLKFDASKKKAYKERKKNVISKCKANVMTKRVGCAMPIIVLTLSILTDYGIDNLLIILKKAEREYREAAKKSQDTIFSISLTAIVASWQVPPLGSFTFIFSADVTDRQVRPDNGFLFLALMGLNGVVDFSIWIGHTEAPSRKILDMTG